jgi:hypothetical protein
MSPRLVLAALTAPPVGILVLVILLTLLAAPEDMPRLQAFGTALFYLELIGTPISYIVGALIGVPAYRYLQRRNRLTLLAALGVGASAGVVSFVPFFFGMYQGTQVLGAILISFVGGACAAAWFWIVGLRHTLANDQPSRA